jgi:hypothetical protein
VGHTTRQPADGLHLVGLSQVGFAALERLLTPHPLRDVRVGRDEAASRHRAPAHLDGPSVGPDPREGVSLEATRQLHATGGQLGRIARSVLAPLRVVAHEAFERRADPTELPRKAQEVQELGVPGHEPKVTVDDRHALPEVLEGALEQGPPLLELALPAAGLSVEPRLLETQGRLVREGLEQADLLGREDAPRTAADAEDPGHLTTDDEGDAEGGAERGAGDPSPGLRVERDPRIGQHVRRPRREPLAHREP